MEDSDLGDDFVETDTTGSELLHHDGTIPTWAFAEGLSSCKFWLDQLCEEEQARFEEALEKNSDWPISPSNNGPLEANGSQGPRCDEGADYPSTDTKVVQRIRRGLGGRAYC